MKNYLSFHFIVCAFLLFLSLILSPEIKGGEKGDTGDFTFEVPANRLWTESDIKVKKGEYIKISAEGQIEITKWSFFGRNEYDYLVGPEGTYNFSEKVTDESFPMHSANVGPVPCYSLIGKINENGETFFIGKEYGFVVPEDGVLFFGINDFKVNDNKGSFKVSIRIDKENHHKYGIDDKRKIEIGAIPKTMREQNKVQEPKVLMIYIDGLTYDVLQEMVFTGYLPNIKKYFFDQGTEFMNTFTTFPSSTFQSVASTLTGAYTDLTGIKYEMFFDREKKVMDHFFKPFGPNAAARIMRPEFLGKADYQRTEPLKMIYDYVTENGGEYKASILPIQHESPPDHVMQTISNAEYLGAHTVHYNLDNINAAYSLEYVIKKENDLMIVWLPGPDVSGHITARGLWGHGRKELFLDDRIIGQIMEKLKKEGIFDQTYKILYSDHGHHGGQFFINQNYDISNELFYKSILRNSDGLFEKSGLGFNVRFAIEDSIVKRFHSDTNDKDFMVSAVEGFGMVNIYLPYQSKYSGDMLKRNNLYNLTNYEIYPDLPAVNILDKVLNVDCSDSNLYPGRASSKPVDLVLLKLDDTRVLVLKYDGSQAIIEHKRISGTKRSFEYQYKVVRDIKQDRKGNITYHEVLSPQKDPLGYYDDPYITEFLKTDPNWFYKYHSADEWLEASTFSEYPDAVVQFTHFFLWDHSIKELETRQLPDFVVTANRGWNFRADGVASTDHGYPFKDTMRVPLFVAGPHIKQGIMITEPHRIVDILPTVLDLLSIEYDPESLDGTSLSECYKSSAAEDNTLVERKEELLRLPYVAPASPLTSEKNHGKREGVSIHSYDSPFDLHNIAADAKFVFDLSIFKMSDDMLDLIIPGNKVKPIEKSFDASLNAVDTIPDNIAKKRFLELLSALRIRHFSVSDMSILWGDYVNEGNYHRVNSLIDWMQNVMGDFNKLLGAPFYKFEKGLIPAKHFNQYVIDYPQSGMEIARKKLVEFFGKVVFKSIFSTEYGLGKIAKLIKNENTETPEIIDNFDEDMMEEYLQDNKFHAKRECSEVVID